MWYRIRYEEAYILSGYTGFEVVIVALHPYSSGLIVRGGGGCVCVCVCVDRLGYKLNPFHSSSV